jgi:hypothetical protein
MITYKPLPIKDACVQHYLTHVPFEQADTQAFKAQYDAWIHASQHTSILGLERFATALTDGVTSAFADFTHAYPNKELVVFKGEYPYHRDTGATVINNVNNLQPGTKLILSVPFAATGNVPDHYEEILDRCTQLNIPVFIDMAYFGACKLGEVNIDYKCVKIVAFSLSKTFGTGKCKIGMCYYRDIPTTPMQLLNEYNYVNHIAINLHTPIIENFTPDYMYDVYRDKQVSIARLLEIDPSDTVFLCTTHDPKFKGFSRAGYINRIGIADLLVKDNFEVENIQWHIKP